MSAEAPDPRRWLALALLCGAFFMVILDVSIVNVALPSIQEDLEFSRENLQWVITAYALTYGGFLLLGGRAADFLGRRRVFIGGVVLFTLASLWCGLSSSEWMLILARGVQGTGAAIISPAALSIITTTFREGSERNKALGIWGAMGGGGAAAGVLLGGILTTYLGWEWIFFVNVPIGAFVVAFAPVLVRESRVTTHQGYDAAGAVTVTAGLMVLVFALVKAPDYGWASGKTILLFAASAVLLALFVAIELRSREPLVPLGIFARLRTLTGANVVGFLLGSIVFAMFFILSLYMQQVLGFSALRAGLGYLAVALTAMVSAGVAQALVTRIGVKPALAFGLVALLAGNLWFTQVSVDGRYSVDLLPGFFAIGVGLGFSFVPVSIAALAGVSYDEAGLASGLINTSQQIGGALGLAVLSTVATTHANSVLHGKNPSPDAIPKALTSGFSWAFWVAVGFAVAGLVATLVMIRREELVTVEAGAAAVG